MYIYSKHVADRNIHDSQTRWPSNSTLLHDKLSRKRTYLLQMRGRAGDEEQAEGLLSACCDRGRKGRAPATVLRLAACGHCSGDDHS
jgi:hypothetical protein